MYVQYIVMYVQYIVMYIQDSVGYVRNFFDVYSIILWCWVSVSLSMGKSMLVDAGKLRVIYSLWPNNLEIHIENNALFIEYHQYKSIFTSAEHFSSIRKVSDCVNSSSEITIAFKTDCMYYM